MDEVNFSEYIDDVKKQSTDMGFEKVCDNSVRDMIPLFTQRKERNRKKIKLSALS